MASFKERNDVFESILNSLRAEYGALLMLCDHRERELAHLRLFVSAEANSSTVYLDNPYKEQHPEWTKEVSGSSSSGYPELNGGLEQVALTTAAGCEDEESVLGTLDLRDKPTEPARGRISAISVSTNNIESNSIDIESSRHQKGGASQGSAECARGRISAISASENNVESTDGLNSTSMPKWSVKLSQHLAQDDSSSDGRPKKKWSRYEKVGIGCSIFLPIAIMISTQGFAFSMWPPCQDGLPCEYRQSQPQLMRSFAREVVPRLKTYTPNFASMGQATGSAPNNNRDCFEPLIDWLHSTLGGFVTNPSTVNHVLRHIGIANLSLVRDAMGELLTSPYDYTSLLNVSASCARQNPMLNSYMCAAVDDPSLRPSLISSDELSISMHLYLVLEKLANVGRSSSALYSLLGQHFQRTSTDTEAKIVDYSRRTGVSAVLAKFRTQKWHSVELSGAQRVKLKTEPYEAGKYFQYNAMVNIMEATLVDYAVDVTNSVDLGLALSADVSTHWPYVDADHQMLWDFGKDWINAYVAWNMNYVVQLGSSSYISKLAIPSIMCSADPGVATPPGWLPPEPSMWFAARGLSLKSNMAYNADRKWELQEAFKYEFEMSHEVRNRWALITKQHANLPHPPECCGQGSLKAMYDQALPYDPATKSPTSILSDEDFLLYTTFLLWSTVIVCAYAAEALLGESLIKFMGKHGRTYWRSVGFLFPACLSIAIFSQSVMGLPFLWLGLWKGGVPETAGSIIHGIKAFKTYRLQGAASYIAGVGLIVHHSATSFIICGVMRGLLPLSRPLSCACSIPVLQHLFAPVRYLPWGGNHLYTVTMILLEIWFEIEVIANLNSFQAAHGLLITRLGRGFAVTMLVSHWLYLLSGALDIIANVFSNAYGNDGPENGKRRTRWDSFSMIKESSGVTRQTMLPIQKALGVRLPSATNSGSDHSFGGDNYDWEGFLWKLDAKVSPKEQANWNNWRMRYFHVKKDVFIEDGTGTAGVYFEFISEKGNMEKVRSWATKEKLALLSGLEPIQMTTLSSSDMQGVLDRAKTYKISLGCIQDQVSIELPRKLYCLSVKPQESKTTMTVATSSLSALQEFARLIEPYSNSLEAILEADEDELSYI